MNNNIDEVDWILDAMDDMNHWEDIHTFQMRRDQLLPIARSIFPNHQERTHYLASFVIAILERCYGNRWRARPGPVIREEDKGLLTRMVYIYCISLTQNMNHDAIYLIDNIVQTGMNIVCHNIIEVR